MHTNVRIVSFAVAQPFDVAYRRLRQALDREGLRVVHELDAAARLRHELGVDLRQNTVLYVDDPVQMLEAVVMSPEGGLFVPEPVVLAEADSACRLAIRSAEWMFGAEVPLIIRSAASSIHERIVAAVLRVAHKESAVPQVATYGPVPA